MTDDEIRYPKISVNNQPAPWLLDDDDIEDAVFIAELQRRMDRDTGIRIPLDEALRRCGITREELDAMREEFDTTDQSDAIENGTIEGDDA